MPTLLRLSPIIAMLLLLALLPAPGRAQEPNRAAVVIQHGDGRVVTACVGFSEPSISGLALLEAAGVSVIAQRGGIGAAVCKIDGEGCDYPAEDCFCKRDGPRAIYWAYHRLVDSQWAYSQLGASQVQVKPGEVDGWAWGTGSSGIGAKPPLLSFDQVCNAQPAPTPAAVQTQAIASPIPTQAPPTAVQTQAITPLVPTQAPPTAVQTQAITPPVPTQAPPTAVQTQAITSLVPTQTPPMPAPTQAPPAPTQTVALPGSAGGYLAFGGLVLMLLIAIGVFAHRRG